MKMSVLKKIILIAVALAITVFMLTGIAGCSKVSSVTTPITENILAGLNARDYSVFSKNFDDRLKSELSEDNFDELLAAVDEGYGTYKEGTLKFQGFNIENNITTANYIADFTKKSGTQVQTIIQKSGNSVLVVGFWIK
ncbi:MAG: hypothetical protein BWY60_01067 [Actinobacteria bacterium ADurb.Bin346]|nr:MAG: hypothetical protein BWY60_01067 [Actinobacteria bacterium ADurb.Bin346]